MKVSKNLPIDLASFVDYVEMNSGKIGEEIVEDFIEFINKDKYIVSAIQQMLISRLKYSTGRLFNSIGVQANKGKKGFDAKVSADVNIVNIYVTIDTDNQQAINALLGAQELSTREIAPPPSIKTLTSWIRGKRKYYNKQIDAIKDRQKDTVRVLLQRQKSLIGGESRKINIPEKLYALRGSEYQDPIYHLAKVIRGRMVRRISKGLPPTKGSEYVFLGNYPEYEGRNGRSSFAPKYTIMSTPLLNVRRSKKSIGDINTFMAEAVNLYYRGVMQQYKKKNLVKGLSQKKTKIKSAREEYFGEKEKSRGSASLSNQLLSITSTSYGNLFNSTMNLINIMSKMVEESSGSNRTKAKREWLASSRKIIIQAVDDLFPIMNQKRNESFQDIYKALNESRKRLCKMSKFVAPPVKRRAIRKFEKRRR